MSLEELLPGQIDPLQEEDPSAVSKDSASETGATPANFDKEQAKEVMGTFRHAALKLMQFIGGDRETFNKIAKSVTSL